MGLLDDLFRRPGLLNDGSGILNGATPGPDGRQPAPFGFAPAADGMNQQAWSQLPPAPLSLAGPGLATDVAAASRGRSPAAVGWPDTGDRLPAGVPGWARAPAMTPSAGFPDPSRTAPQLTAQNLTAHALRMKGVSEADIAEARSSPEKLQQLLNQYYGPGSNVQREEDPRRSPTRGDYHRAIANDVNAPSWGDILSDVGRSGVSGLEQSGIGLAGLFGDSRDLASAATDYLGNKFGIDPNKRNSLRNFGAKFSQFTHLSDAPTSNQLRSSFESVMGPLYQPKTDYGQVAQTVGEYGSALISAPEMLVPKLLSKAVQRLPERLVTRMVAPALTSEGAGYLAKDTKYEPQARIVGSMLGGVGTANTAREIRTAPIPAVTGQLDNNFIRRSPMSRSGYAWPNLDQPWITGLLGGLNESHHQSLQRAWDDAE
jgi:hypothetical protein